MPVREQTELVLGRGEVFFERFPNGVGSGDGEMYFGNTPSFQISREIERLETFRSYSGRKHQGRSKVISETVEVRMTTDNIQWENVALWFGAGETDVSVGDEFLPYTETFVVRKGRFYQLGKPYSPSGFQFVERVTITRGGVTLLPGVDYDLEPDRGRIQILRSSARVSDGQGISVTYRKRPNGVFYAEPAAAEVYGALRYISHNPYGPQTDFWFPQVRITPQGAVDMKGDEYQQMRFDITAIRAAPNMPLLYATRPGDAPRPITADTNLITADTTNYTADKGLWVTEG